MRSKQSNPSGKPTSVRAGFVCLPLLVMALATGARADSTLEYSSQTADQEPSTRTLIVKDGRVGFLAGDSNAVYTIFDEKQSAFAFINHHDRQYTIISRQWMQQMQQRAQESMKKMQEKLDKQLQNMPPQQRAMYQQGRMMMPMMAPYMANLTRPNHLRTVVPLYITQTVNDVQCRRVDVLEGGRKTQELCVAQRDQLSGLSDGDYQTLLAMLKVVRELDTLGAFALGFKRPFLASWGGGSPGLPVAVTEHAGKAATATKLRAFNTEAVDPDKLQLPEHYLQAQIPMPIR